MQLLQYRHTELRSRVAAGVDSCSRCGEMSPGVLQLVAPIRNTHEFEANRRCWRVIHVVVQMKELRR